MSENTSPQPTPGIFGWNELITSDVEGAKKFYGDLFGWTSETKAIAPGWDYTMFKNGGTVVGGMIGITPEMGPLPPHWLSYVFSSDIEADVAKAKHHVGNCRLAIASRPPDLLVVGIKR